MACCVKGKKIEEEETATIIWFRLQIRDLVRDPKQYFRLEHESGRDYIHFVDVSQMDEGRLTI